VEYPGHVQEHRELMRAWAGRYDLITTGGSDCHDRVNRPLGVAGVGEAELETLLALLGETVHA
jgi:3',5'-nucleoside bisphosphate phosphatase